MSAKIPHFETMEEPELNYIKVLSHHAIKVPFRKILADIVCR